MARKSHFTVLFVLILASYSLAEVPITAEVVQVKKIWDKAPHNAFTDLVRWHDAFYCAFREGRGHVSTDGKIRILESKDADVWTSATLISLEGFDLRDAHLSVTPDGRLMLLGGAAPREKDNQSAPTGTFVSFSKDGRQWTQPQIAVEPGRWLWCVTWHEGKAYGVSYTAGKGSEPYLDLLVSDDGIHYKQHVPRLLEQGYPTEVTLRFDSEDTCYALVRRDRHDNDPSSALLGISRPDYKQWQWKDLGSDFNGFGGPNFIQIPAGFWLAAGRMHDGGAHTALCYLDVKNGKMTRLIKLPSGGDTSYPGMVWHNDVLYVSYYSSHEAKTSIYLAKVKTSPIGLCKITGVVRDQKGNSIAGVEVRRLHGPHPVNTDAMGRYELVWDPKRNRPLVDTYYIIGRHWQKNLSVVMEVPEFDPGTEIVDLNLQPGVTFKGKVIDPGGRGIEQARVDILLHTPTQGSGLYDTIADYEGLFEFRGIPTGHEYSFVARASRHGTKWVNDIFAGHDFAQKDFELEQLTLAIADQSVSGMVVDTNDKPVSGVFLSTYGEGQPYYNIQTDTEGKFKINEVCSGDLRILATVRGETQPSGYTLTYGGARDVRIVVKDIPSPDRRSFMPKSPPPLMGKNLPSLENLNISFDLEQHKGKIILICFWDMNQRPSRNCIQQLNKRAQELKKNDVVAVAVHASKIERQKLDEWVIKNSISFPVGVITDEEEKIRFVWGVKSLPWLILTDRKHIVTAEGFNIDELDGKVETLTEENSF
jgi:hypothetical protein